MKHLLDIRQLTVFEVNSLILRAQQFKTTTMSRGVENGGRCEQVHFKKRNDFPCYSAHTLATLFYENSTRTRISFELAAKYLGMGCVNVDIKTSSETKGEAIEDTLQTLSAMGIQLFVIRHSENGLPARMAKKLGPDRHLVNAGDGQHAHPSQALLDLMTIMEHKPALDRLKIAVVGDLLHSRVSHSFQELCALMGVGELRLVAPPVWQPRQVLYGRVVTSLEEGLDQADVVICLRVQRERIQETEQFDLTLYRQQYALTQQSLAFAKKDAVVMHPGPINRGVEIDSDVADSPQSVILQQVQNGVFMRAAILEKLISRPH